MIRPMPGILQSLTDAFRRTFRHWHGEKHLSFTLSDLSVLVNGTNDRGYTAPASQFGVHNRLNDILRILEEHPPGEKTQKTAEFRAIDFIRALKTLNHAVSTGPERGPFYVPQSRVSDLYRYSDILDEYILHLNRCAPEHDTCRRSGTENIFEIRSFRKKNDLIIPDAAQMAAQLMRFGMYLDALKASSPFVFPASAAPHKDGFEWQAAPKADIK